MNAPHLQALVKQVNAMPRHRQASFLQDDWFEDTPQCKHAFCLFIPDTPWGRFMSHVNTCLSDYNLSFLPVPYPEADLKFPPAWQTHTWQVIHK